VWAPPAVGAAGEDLHGTMGAAIPSTFREEATMTRTWFEPCRIKIVEPSSESVDVRGVQEDSPRT
jgi:hypothetical protein